MKVAMISPYFNCIDRGAEAATRGAKIALNNRNHDVNIFSFGIGEQIIQVSKIQKLFMLLTFFFEETYINGFSKRFLGIPIHLNSLLFSIKLLSFDFSQYDLIWSYGEYFEVLACKKISLKYDIPLLVVFSGRRSKMMEREAKLFPDIFVVLSPIDKKWTKQRVPDCNVSSVASGVPSEIFNQNVKPLKGFSFEHPIILSTSAFIKFKRIHIIIDALSKLNQGTLLLTNDGPLKKGLLKKCFLQLKGRHHYFGCVSPQQLASIYKTADFFIIASKNEPFGTSILEALNCNVPVIAQKDETHEWMIGDGGILLDDISDVDILSETIKNNSSKNFGDKPCLQGKKFSWDNLILEYEKLIDTVIIGR